MADELQDIDGQEEGVDEVQATSGTPKLLSLLAVLVGGALGFLVLGPMVVGSPASGAEGAEAAAHDDDPGAEADAAATELFSVENLVVNPAGTDEILRFLMVTVAVEPDSPDAMARMEANEIVLRDALLRSFALHTTDELLDMEGRGALLDELQGVIEAVVGPGTVNRIFLPQYVIQ
jgi:flagellar basal body-associated protein FliL